MHYKTKRAEEPADDCAPLYCRLLDGELDRIGYSFSTRCGLLFLASNTQRAPNIANALRLFQIVDPLVSKIVTIRDEKVRVEWERRSQVSKQTIPLRVSGKLKKGAPCKHRVRSTKSTLNSGRRRS